VVPAPFEVITGALSFDIVDCDGNGLDVSQGAIGDLDGDVVDIVGAGIGRVLVVGEAETNDRAPVEASTVNLAHRRRRRWSR